MVATKQIEEDSEISWMICRTRRRCSRLRGRRWPHRCHFQLGRHLASTITTATDCGNIAPHSSPSRRRFAFGRCQVHCWWRMDHRRPREVLLHRCSCR